MLAHLEDWEQGLEMLNTAQTRDRQASLRHGAWPGDGGDLLLRLNRRGELEWMCFPFLLWTIDKNSMCQISRLVQALNGSTVITVFRPAASSQMFFAPLKMQCRLLLVRAHWLLSGKNAANSPAQKRWLPCFCNTWPDMAWLWQQQPSQFWGAGVQKSSQHMAAGGGL